MHGLRCLAASWTEMIDDCNIVCVFFLNISEENQTITTE